MFGTIRIGSIYVGLTIVAAFLVDRVGRRLLLPVSLVGMVASLTVLAAAYTIPGMGGLLGPLTIASLMLFVAFHAVSLGSVVWLAISETFALNVRGAAMGVTTLVLWFANFLIAQFFLSLFEIGASVAFGVFVGISVAGLVFVYAFVPETKGRSLEEIEADLREICVGSEELTIADQIDPSDRIDHGED